MCCCPACSRVAQGHAGSTRIQACWRGYVARDDYQAAKQAKAKKERRAKRKAAATRIQACWRGYVARDDYQEAKHQAWLHYVHEEMVTGPAVARDGLMLRLSLRVEKMVAEALDDFEWEERVCGVNSELGRAKALVAASKNFDAVYAAAYAEQVEYAKLLLGHMHIRQSVTRLQACWRGVLGRKYCKAAKWDAGAMELLAEFSEIMQRLKAAQEQLDAATRIQACSVSERRWRPRLSTGRLACSLSALPSWAARSPTTSPFTAESAAASGCSRASCRRASGAV